MIMMTSMMMMMLMMMVRGPGKAPALLSGGDCSAVSQFIPGKDLQEVLCHHSNHHRRTIKLIIIGKKSQKIPFQLFARVFSMVS